MAKRAEQMTKGADDATSTTKRVQIEEERKLAEKKRKISDTRMKN